MHSVLRGLLLSAASCTFRDCSSSAESSSVDSRSSTSCHFIFELPWKRTRVPGKRESMSINNSFWSPPVLYNFVWTCTLLLLWCWRVTVCNVPPLRKQCQAVGGQEIFHPISSSSDREDLVDTMEPHSLLFCRRKKRFRYLLVDLYLGRWLQTWGLPCYADCNGLQGETYLGAQAERRNVDYCCSWRDRPESWENTVPKKRRSLQGQCTFSAVMEYYHSWTGSTPTCWVDAPVTVGSADLWQCEPTVSASGCREAARVCFAPGVTHPRPPGRQVVLLAPLPPGPPAGQEGHLEERNIPQSCYRKIQAGTTSCFFFLLWMCQLKRGYHFFKQKI